MADATWVITPTVFKEFAQVPSGRRPQRGGSSVFVERAGNTRVMSGDRKLVSLFRQTLSEVPLRACKMSQTERHLVLGHERELSSLRGISRTSTTSYFSQALKFAPSIPTRASPKHPKPRSFRWMTVYSEPASLSALLKGSSRRRFGIFGRRNGHSFAAQKLVSNSGHSCAVARWYRTTLTDLFWVRSARRDANVVKHAHLVGP